MSSRQRDAPMFFVILFSSRILCPSLRAQPITAGQRRARVRDRRLLDAGIAIPGEFGLTVDSDFQSINP
jgi:hypothetical protein